MFTALTIAGSDSGGGAGIQADLKTFAAYEVYGTSVITAITAQNTCGVTDISELSSEMVLAQLDAVLSDIGAHAAKTGMLFSTEIVEAVADGLRRWQVHKLVVDPVMVAKGGDRLLREQAVFSLKENLLPLALVVTPNLAEAEMLTNRPVRYWEERQDAARALHGMGVANVVIKGGHLNGDPVDLLYDGEEFTTFPGTRLDSRNTHGTGCTFSAAIAAQLARGSSVAEAVGNAKQYVHDAIEQAPGIGQGHGPLQHFPRRTPA